MIYLWRRSGRAAAIKPLKKLARSVAKRLLAYGEPPPAPLPPEILRLRAANAVVLRARFRCVKANDLKLYIDTRDALVGAPIALGTYEPHLIAALRRTVRPGDTVLDIGATIGLFSMLCGEIVGPRGRVHAFEPRADNVAMLQLSLRENGLDNVLVHEVAVADHDRSLAYKPIESTSPTLMVEESSAARDGGFVPVRTVAIDDVLAEVTRVDVVKIDIDGYELGAIRGMRQLLGRCRPIVFFEYCPECLRSTGRHRAEDLLEEFRMHGYSLHILRPDGTWDDAETNAAIGAAHQASGSTHIDLVACPPPCCRNESSIRGRCGARSSGRWPRHQTDRDTSRCRIR